MVFYVAEEHLGGATVSPDVAATLREQGMKVAEFHAEVRTLADVSHEYVGNRFYVSREAEPLASVLSPWPTTLSPTWGPDASLK
jgi:hypothetical protein